MASPVTVHASCVLVGEQGVLIRGASGAGKSHLAFALILAGRTGAIPPTLLVADDRVMLERRADPQSAGGGDRLVAFTPPPLAGLIEIRGLGIRRLPYAAQATIALVVDLGAQDSARMPSDESLSVEMDGIILPRLPAFSGGDIVQQVLALLLTEPGAA